MPVGKYGHKRKPGGINAKQVKLGHGGTLDPIATGVLIIGVGSGTKQLQSFLGCTKTYETAILFGRSSDTYDVVGKTVASAPYEHITRKLVEEKLGLFRGQVKQVPPIYSALKINGMKAYEYARSGQELPRELESRDMVVTECELTDWHDGGKHEYRWPTEEAPEEEKEVARMLLKTDQLLESQRSERRAGEKRKTSVSESTSAVDDGTPSKRIKTAVVDHPDQLNVDNTVLDSTESLNLKPFTDAAAAKAAEHTHAPTNTSSPPASAPAASVYLTVSSGFYVRSFANDLGIACGSLGMMASLIRSRQGDFTLSQCLTYDDLAAGEDVWAPKVTRMLDRWNMLHPADILQQDRRKVLPALDIRQQDRRKRRRKDGRNTSSEDDQK